MKKNLIVLTVLALAVCAPVAQSATITVPGMHPTIQAAVTAAANGDTIEIANGTYTEDIWIPGSSLLSKNNLTLQPATGASVTIEAANTVLANSGARGLVGLALTIAGAGPLPDQYGLLVEGSGITLRDLTIRNLATTGNAVGESAAVLVVGDNCTITNCTLECDPGNDNGRGVYVWTGAFVWLDAISGGAVTASGYAAPRTSANLTVTNCTLKYGDASFDTVDVAYYFAIENGLIPPPIPVTNPSGTITNTEVIGYIGGGSLGELDCGDYVWTNCHFHDGHNPVEIGGGKWEFNDCVFERSSSNSLLYVQANLGEAAPTLADVDCNNCLFCGGGDDRLARINEGDVAFSGCVFNVTETAGSFAAVRYDCGDVESEYALLGGFPATTGVSLDHCDIFNPNGIGVRVADHTLDAGEPTASLSVANSIIYSTTGVNLTVGGAVSRTANVHDNDIFAITQIGNSGAWTLTAANNLNVDPQYNGPGSCVANAYLYFNSSLGTADESGGALGSQGPLESTSVDNWSLY